MKSVQTGGTTKAAFLTDGNYDEDMAGMGGLGGPAYIVDEPDRFDDDRLPFEADGDTRILCERDAESTEEEAVYLAAYAQSYHEVRRSLRDDRNGQGFSSLPSAAAPCTRTRRAGRRTALSSE